MTHALALIIEDDPKLGAIYQTIVEQAGYIAEIIQTGDQAMKRLDTATPNLVLLDIHLPHVSGRDILQRIRSDKRLMHIPVIVLTADQHVTPAVTEQAYHVLTKSLGISQLRSLVARLRRDSESDTTEVLQSSGDAT